MGTVFKVIDLSITHIVCRKSGEIGCNVPSVLSHLSNVLSLIIISDDTEYHLVSKGFST